MYLCYIDESGTGQVLNPEVPDSTPVMVIGGFSVPEAQLKALTWDFIAFKKKYEPSLRKAPRPIQVIRHELKGDTIRRKLRTGSPKHRRMAHSMLDDLLALLERHDCKVMARIWVKEERVVNDEAAMYGASVRALCENFEHYLAERVGHGVVILDSRSKVKNIDNVHCVTTEKFRDGADRLPHVAESPVFGHSDTHAGLQIADLLISGILFPAACATYADDLSWNLHCHPRHAEARDHHCPRLGKLQHRYQSEVGKWTGGVVVSDQRQHWSAGRLFTSAPSAQPAAAIRIPSPTRALDLAATAGFRESTTDGRPEADG